VMLIHGQFIRPDQVEQLKPLGIFRRCSDAHVLLGRLVPSRSWALNRPPGSRRCVRS
jgi:hypothetical protein